MIIPVGLEKMIPSCQAAERVMGIYHNQFSLGTKTGYMMIANANRVTEIESLKILMDVESVQVAGGGVGGMEGSVILAAKYKTEVQAQELIKLIKKFNNTPQLVIKRRQCAVCHNQCDFIKTN